jgi:hypothetical protein
MLWERIFGENLPTVKAWCKEHGYTVKSMVILAAKKFMGE